VKAPDFFQPLRLYQIEKQVSKFAFQLGQLVPLRRGAEREAGGGGGGRADKLNSLVDPELESAWFLKAPGLNPC
jgi:hypothetical protein